MQVLPILLISSVALGVLILGYSCAPALIALWREPVLKRPVLIIESDDWGPGDESDAQRLDRLASLLAQFKNRSGRSPVLTLGIVLAIPDTRLMREDLRNYRRLLLSDDRFASIVRAIRRGFDTGVFSPHLHALEHYWPAVLLAVAARDERTQSWLTQNSVPRTEDLPAPLQSRWTDVSVLPSRPLPLDAIKTAVAEETAAFAAIFGEPARVVVPPTFVWDERVEAAWGAAGVRVIVTPGKRYEGRNSTGAPDRAGPRIYNGSKGAGDLIYVVRDDYFEPALGHRAERGHEAVARKTRAGRPTLLETHRFNFVGEATAAKMAFADLERMLSLVLEEFPDVLFMSTLEMAERIRQLDPELIERRMMRHLHVWLVRLGEIPRFRKLAWLTGIMIPASLLFFLTRPRPIRVTTASRQ
jgi:hypothetical protein